MAEPKRHHVAFPAKKKVPEKVEVDFTTKDGTEVTFPARKKVTKKVKVDFMAKNKRK